MRVLYIKRNFWNDSFSWWKNKRNIRKRYFKFKDQDGYLRGSLYHRFTVDEKPLGYLYRRGAHLGKYHYLIVNYKADSSGSGARFADEFNRPRVSDGMPVVLYLGDAPARIMPGDALLDQFDLVLKRQPYKDLDRYPIAARNKDKIRPTTLACPLIPATKKNIRSIRAADYGFAAPAADCGAEVFFSGQANSKVRTQAWARVVDAGFHCLGGLQPDDTHNTEPLASLAAPKMNKTDYVDAMRDARVNLALDGLGEFTYRHVEAWCLACLTMCSPTTRDLMLPFPAAEGEHFVCYDDLDDLVDKLRYFKTDDAERMRIAAAGRRLFEQYYSFEYHGRQLQHWFDNPQSGSIHP